MTHDFTLVGSWLDRLQRESRTGSIVLDDEAIATWVQPVVDCFARIGWSDEEECLFSAVSQLAFDIRGVELPLVAVHGDFSVLNLLVDRRGIAAVVDWELAAPSGLPFRDIYKFPTSYCCYLDRAVSEPGEEVPGHPGWQQAQRAGGHLATGRTWSASGTATSGADDFPISVRRSVAMHFSSLHLDPRLHGVFFPLFLAEQAMTLDDPIFRDGYRSVLAPLAFERSSAQHPELLEANR